MRVGLPHLGQSVLLVVSITFLRSAVFAIFISSPDHAAAGPGPGLQIKKISGVLLKAGARPPKITSVHDFTRPAGPAGTARRQRGLSWRPSRSTLRPLR